MDCIINLKLHSTFLLFVSNNFSLFLLFSVLVTGLIVNPLAFAQDSSTNGTTTSVNATDTIVMDESSNPASTEMTESSNSTSTEEALESEDEMAETEENMIEDEDMMGDENMMEDEEETVLSPLKQIKEGVAPENIICKEGLELVFKLNGQPACVKTTSIEKLIAWGWAQ